MKRLRFASLLTLVTLSLATTFVPPAHAATPPLPVASYNIQVTLDPATKMLRGQETIIYVNTTKTPFKDLVFHLYLNAFRDKNSTFNKEAGSLRGFSWDAQNPGWIKINSLRMRGGSPLNVVEIEDGTLARAELPSAIAPNESITLEVSFEAQLPKIFARTGFAKDFFMVGQWFPKLGVWQDKGWNAYVFHANSEFFADFGNYEVAVTVPKNFGVAASGLPVDSKENSDGTKTWRYKAENVIDFAWAASPRFKEASRKVNNTELLYVYLEEHESSKARVLNATEGSFKLYSEWFGAYPYARLTIVDVPNDGEGAGGMEYPTLVTAGSLGSSTGIDRFPEAVVVHEVGHQWWQSMVATNEAEEPWLDEGFTDYATGRALDKLYGGNTSVLETPALNLSYLDLRRLEYTTTPRTPMFGTAWELKHYSIAAYGKPLLALRTLENVLGESTMLKVMQTYFAKYQYGHPTTKDFRQVAEEVTRQDLTWFFEGLVYGDGILNYSVTNITEHTVTLKRQGELIIPTDVLITFADGITATQTWDGKQSELTLTYNTQALRRAEIDPQRKLVIDLQWNDNGLTRTPDLPAWSALMARILYLAQSLLLGMGGN